VQVPVNIPALAVTVSTGPAPAAPMANGAIIAFILEYGAKVLPIVLADLAAGKTWAQILADIAAALLPTTKPPCKKC
jgi:hypothetical protein